MFYQREKKFDDPFRQELIPDEKPPTYLNGVLFFAKEYLKYSRFNFVKLKN